jgi:hypothetical protein
LAGRWFVKPPVTENGTSGRSFGLPDQAAEEARRRHLPVDEHRQGPPPRHEGMNHRRLARDYETHPHRSEAMIKLAMIDLMSRRLAREGTLNWRGTWSPAPAGLAWARPRQHPAGPKISRCSPGGHPSVVTEAAECS